MNKRSNYFYHFGQSDFIEKRKGIFIKSITGSQSQLCLIRLQPGMETMHSHENEQIGYILSGTATIKIANHAQTLEPGDGYLIPSNIEHGFFVPRTNPLEYIEIFCPPKQENTTDQ
jgi:unsaturated pyranuronate lyase